MRKGRTQEPLADKDVRTRAHRQWTIMIYMAGDNNLSADMANSLSELERRSSETDGSGGNVNVLAYFDGASLTAPTQYIDYTDTKPFTHTVTPFDLRPVKGSSNPEFGDPEDSASVRSILSFIRWGIERRNATANNYALIFSGHSFGFYGTSFMRDQSSGRFLSLRRFRWALERALFDYLHPTRPDKKISLIGFDSCEMGMLEVGYELKNVARTVVSSAGNVPNAGWGYAPMLSRFVQDGSFEETLPEGIRPDNTGGLKEAARHFVTEYVCQQQKFKVGGNSIDMAAIDLDVIDPLARNVGKLGRLLSDMLGLDRLVEDGKISERRALVHNRTKALIARSRMNCQTYMHEQSVDLKDFCQRLMFGCREILHEADLLKIKLTEFRHLLRLCAQIISEVDECVLQSGFSGDEYQFSKGMSLYFPWTALTYLYTWNVYGSLRFSCGDFKLEKKGGKVRKRLFAAPAKDWDDFLLFYLYIVTLRQGETVDAFDDAFKRLDDGGLVYGEWQQTRLNWIEARRNRTVKSTNGTSVTFRKVGRENWRTGTRENWPLTGTRENPRPTGTKGPGAAVRGQWPRLVGSENPRTGTRENPRVTGTRENPRITGSKGTVSVSSGRFNPRVTGDRGVFSADDYLSFFSRIRNFALDWEAEGLSPKADCPEVGNGTKPKRGK